MTDEHKPPTQESTTFGKPVLMFYVCCTAFGTAFGVAAVMLIVFGSSPAAIPLAVIATIVGIVTVVMAIRYLQLARGER